MMTMVYFLLLLTVIICIHEAGHLLVAKLFHVYCFEYSFGMGPVLFRKKGKETDYCIRAIPIGGFVAMAGESDGDEAYPDVMVPEGRRLPDQAPWKRILIMLAGVFMNFLLALVIFSLIILHNGGYVKSPEPVVDQVVANTPAETAGFQAGDYILSIRDEAGESAKPKSYTDLRIFLSQYTSGELTYTVKRSGETVEIHVVPEADPQTGELRIGIIGPDADVLKVNLLNCWVYGAHQMVTIARLMASTILRLISGRGLEQLSGPVGIYSATEQYVSMGLTSYLFLIAELSLNIGIFNLLPLTILDGGQVVTTILEWITGRKLNAKLKMWLMAACWALLISVMIFATWNDLVRLFG